MDLLDKSLEGILKIESKLSDGHKKAIVQMYAAGSSIQDLATWYRVTSAEVREVLNERIQFAEDQSV